MLGLRPVALLALTMMATGLGGCGVPGHTSPPQAAHRPLPVNFYGGQVLSVQAAAIGRPDGAIGFTAGSAPGVVLGFSAGPGIQPASGRLGLAAGGISVGPGFEAPASALEYTVALDGSPQIVEITQYVLAEDCVAVVAPTCVIPPRTPVAIRVVGDKGRVIPLATIPPEFQGRVRRTGMPWPLGQQLMLAAPPRIPTTYLGRLQ